MAHHFTLTTKAPRVAEEWSPKNTCTPDDVPPSDSTPRTWVCPIGHEWVASPSARVYKKQKCTKCPRKPITVFAPEVVPQWSPKNSLSPAHYGVSHREDMWWFNDECGHEWQQPPRYRIGGTTCPVCTGHIVITGSNDLATLYPDVAAEWSPLNSTPADRTAAHSNAKVEWVCSTDARHVWKTQVCTRTTNGSGCPFCSGRNHVVGENDLATTHPHLTKLWSPRNKVPMSSVTHGSHVSVEWRCEKGHYWKAQVYNVAIGGNGCAVCGGREVLQGDNDIATTHPLVAAQWHPSNVASPKAVTAGSRAPIRWQCDTVPEHTWVASPFNRTNASNPTGCPECWSTKMVSAPETEMFDFIKSELGEDVEVIQGYRHLRGVHEVDVYIPSLQLAVEFNGVYWHSDRAGKAKHYHWGKRKACEDNGVRLVSVWEDDWTSRRDVVKNALRVRMGTFRGAKHSARVLEWKRVPLREASAFLEDHHIQGAVKATRHDGLYMFSGELVAVLSTTCSGSTYTIDRFATKGNVRGAFGKLLKVLERRISMDGGGQIRTFADLMLSNGDLYSAHGFSMDKELPPAYWVVVGNRRYHTLSFKKNRFRDDPTLKWDDKLSVENLIDLNNLPRVYDAGKLRFVKNVPSAK